MVDTRDLKSLGPKRPCGFESRPRHENSDAIAPLFSFSARRDEDGVGGFDYWAGMPNFIIQTTYESLR